MKQTIRELTEAECRDINGGVAPLIGFAASVVGHFTARSVVTSFASRVGYGLGVYGLASSVGKKRHD